MTWSPSSENLEICAEELDHTGSNLVVLSQIASRYDPVLSQAIDSVAYHLSHLVDLFTLGSKERERIESERKDERKTGGDAA